MTSGTRIESELIRIGNSRGIRLPKSVIEQCHLSEGLVLEIKEDSLVVKASRQTRKGWDEAFAKAKQQDLDEDFSGLQNEWDDSEWTW